MSGTFRFSQRGRALLLYMAALVSPRGAPAQARLGVVGNTGGATSAGGLGKACVGREAGTALFVWTGLDSLAAAEAVAGTAPAGHEAWAPVEAPPPELLAHRRLENLAAQRSSCTFPGPEVPLNPANILQRHQPGFTGARQGSRRRYLMHSRGVL